MPITGVASYVKMFEDPAIAAALPKPQTIEEKRALRKAERKVSAHARARSEDEAWVGGGREGKGKEEGRVGDERAR